MLLPAVNHGLLVADAYWRGTVGRPNQSGLTCAVRWSFGRLQTAGPIPPWLLGVLVARQGCLAQAFIDGRNSLIASEENKEQPATVSSILAIRMSRKCTGH